MCTMRLVILICLLSCFGICCAFQNSKAVEKVGEYPYVVSLSRTSKKDTWYSGVLLTNDWILTSYGPVYPIMTDDNLYLRENINDLFAYAGTLTAFPKDGDAKSQKRRIINATRHPIPSPKREFTCPEYRCHIPGNTDKLVLFKVEKKFDETDHVKPVKLPTDRKFVDNCINMTIVGWCQDGKRHDSGSGILKYVDATRKTCSYDGLLDDSFFCVEYFDMVEHLPEGGNHGQPVLCKGTLIGITQNDPTTYIDDYWSDVYRSDGTVSDINYYTTWIHDITGLQVAYTSTQHGSNRNQRKADAKTTDGGSDTTEVTRRGGGGGGGLDWGDSSDENTLRTDANSRGTYRSADPWDDEESTPLWDYGSKLCPNFPLLMMMIMLTAFVFWA